VKKLYLVRHAKSDYPGDVSGDHDRPLSKRGEKGCKAIGQYMKEKDLLPEKILCSDAVRTSMTVKNILRATGENIPVIYLKELYLATAGEILKILAKVSDDVESVMVVCHNPGVESLAKLLVGGGDKESIERLRIKYPTAGLACFSINTDSWKVIDPQSGFLEEFVTPKILGA
jgi:phosphohistidine phosphatase